MWTGKVGCQTIVTTLNTLVFFSFAFRLSCKMSSFVKLLILLVFFYHCEACPGNCYCSTVESFCKLATCDSPLYFNTMILKVKGTLCENHRSVLSRLANIDLILENDDCLSLSRCRLERWNLNSSVELTFW